MSLGSDPDALIALARSETPHGADRDDDLHLDADEAAAYDDFLTEMDSLGLLSDLEEGLPPGFSVVYEIGRILADPTSQLAKSLRPALALADIDVDEGETPTTSHEPSESMIEVVAAEEYEAEFIRTWSDVRYVYAWQHLLPEGEFLRRLANRTLWYPMAKEQVIEAVDDGDDDFLPTPSKQKVYLLLDTSASMARRHRFAFAKAIALRYLDVNRREMGEISLRTFDIDVGPLQTARDRAGYDNLRQRVARQHTLGNGTCLERAILQACEDIESHRGLAGAEILVITDGAARLDEAKLLAAFGTQIKLHCVKIGDAQVFASDAYVKEVLEYSQRDDTRRDQRILQIRDRLTKLREGLRDARDDAQRRDLSAGIREYEKEQRALGDELKSDYGHEIERICEVYVEVPDLSSATLSIDSAQLAALTRLVQRLAPRLQEHPTSPEALKQAALLLSHLALLADDQKDPAIRAALDQLRQVLEKELECAVTGHVEYLRQGGLLTPGDQRDLRVLLHGGLARGSSLWLVLWRYFRSAIAALARRR